MVAALLAASVTLSRAQDTEPKVPARADIEKLKDEWKKLPPEEREAKLKEWRRTNGVPARSDTEKRREQIKNMTAEERMAKRREIKGRLEKRIGELRARQTNATLSAQESRELERREHILKRFEQEAAAVARTERPRPVLTNSPVKN